MRTVDRVDRQPIIIPDWMELNRDDRQLISIYNKNVPSTTISALFDIPVHEVGRRLWRLKKKITSAIESRERIIHNQLPEYIIARLDRYGLTTPTLIMRSIATGRLREIFADREGWFGIVVDWAGKHRNK